MWSQYYYIIAVSTQQQIVYLIKHIITPKLLMMYGQIISSL